MLVALLVAVFLVSHVIGDPVNAMVPPDASEASREALRESLGLTGTLWEQFVSFVNRTLTGFGDSFWQRENSLGLVLSRLPASLYLAGATLLLAIPSALFMGAWAALHRRGVLTRAIDVLSLGGVSTVDFWLGYMLILVFGVQFGLLPTGGYGTWLHVILPATALAFRPMGLIAQFTRASFEDEYEKLYVPQLRAKGLPERRVLAHVLKNSSIPILTLSGGEFVALASGQLVIETIFAWPGMGRMVIQAVGQRDLFLIEAGVFVIGGVVLIANLLVDVTYAALDPKIRYGS